MSDKVEKTAEEIAGEKGDAFEIGIHMAMKEAQITEPEHQAQFMELCRQTAQAATAAAAE